MRPTLSSSLRPLLLCAAVLPAAAAAQKPAPKPLIPAGPASVRLVNAAGLKQALKEQQGKVVVLNIWATWCVPCLEEYPYFIRLQKEYGAKGLSVLSVTVDEPTDRAKVEAFVSQQKPPFPVYLRKAGGMEAFIAGVDRKWDGIVPATYFFDRKGKAAGKPIRGATTLQEVTARVQPLLAQAGGR
jgi:thiol-disulfide isomerase/thioredoxin